MLKALIKKVKKSKGGFTLIELIVVVCILAILAAILIPSIGGQITNSRASSLKSDAQSIYTTLVTANNDYQTATCSSLTAQAIVALGAAGLVDNVPSTLATDASCKDDLTTICTYTAAGGFKWKSDNIKYVQCTIVGGNITQVQVTGTHGNYYNYPA